MIFLVISRIGYPFGGGEQFLLQSAPLGKKIWVSFENKNRTSHSITRIYEQYGVIFIDSAGGFQDMIVERWIRFFNPNMIHVQGIDSHIVSPLCEKLKIKCIIGYHFWTNLLILKNNVNIENQSIQIHPEFEKVLARRYSFPFVCSKFMKSQVKRAALLDSDICGQALSNIPVIYPISNIFLTKRQSTHITMINIHALKGGEMFLNCLKVFGDKYPFIAVCTEPQSEKLDNEIKKEMIEQCEINPDINHYFLGRIENIEKVYEKTKILLVPSIVDETFCRVACEAMSVGIPVLSYGNGNLQYLLGDANIDMTIENVERCMEDNEYYQSMSSKVKEQYMKLTNKKRWSTLLHKQVEKNVMFLTPFTDQGLGIQVRNYISFLKKSFIFNYHPYQRAAIAADEKEWEVENIYHSPNTRENITDDEILSFIRKFSIDICVIPETCWSRVFEIAELLTKNHVKCIAIPNIEIMKKSELSKHLIFHKILVNDERTQQVLSKWPLSIEKLGFSLNNVAFRPKKTVHSEIVFCCFGGLNGISRKRIDIVAETFVKALGHVHNIKLVITDQTETFKYSHHHRDDLAIIDRHLTCQEMFDILYGSDVCIQVSRHEGLGLGFYESIFTGTPVLTLNGAPHNEIIKDGTNGWIIPCFNEKNKENQECLIESLNFKQEDLMKKILDIARNPTRISAMFETMRQDLVRRFSTSKFKANFRNHLL